ncbi:MAG: tol-pal system protein YbgF [Pseudomonadota bacterium]
MNATRRPLRTLGVVIGGIAALSACVTTPPQEDPVLIKLAEIERRLVALERVVQNDSIVNLAASVDSLAQDVATVRGQVEELGFASSQAADRQRQLYGDLDARMAALEKSAGAAPAASVSSALPVPGGSDEGNYRAAFEMLKEGRYDEASSAFSEFLATYPESDLADNAQYWLAEAHYVSQRFDEALPAFEIVVSEYPRSAKVPDALLKIGYCNYELRNWIDARAALKRVEAEYADTTAARLAAQRLARMQTENR